MATTNPFEYKSDILADLYVENTIYKVDAAQRRLDVDWVADSFFSPRSEMIGETSDWSFMSSADHKFTDSQWGGNFAVNTRPQYTPLSDPRRMGTSLWHGRKSIFELKTDPILDISNLGMGRIYSEQYDDNAHRVYFRFGVPQYNSLTKFLENMSSSEAVSLATTGSSFSFSRIVGAIIAARFLWSAIPITTVFMVFSKAASFLFQNKLLAGTNQFYSLKSVQGQYWNTVQSMVNEYMIATGVLKYGGAAYQGWNSLTKASSKDEVRDKLNPDGTSQRENIKYIASLLPEVFDENYGLSVVGMLGRAGRRSVAASAELNEGKFRYRSNEGNYKLIKYTEAVMESVRRRAKGEQENLNNDMYLTTTDEEIKEALIRTVSNATKSLGANVSEEEIHMAIRAYHSTALWFSAIQSAWFNPSILATETLDKIYAAGSAAVSAISGAIGSITGQEVETAERVRGGATDVQGQILKTQDHVQLIGDTSTIKDESSLTAEERKILNVKREHVEATQLGILDHLDYALKFGLEFVQFEVSYTPQTQEGASNNVQPAPLGEMMRGVAGSARTFKNMVANGNIGDGIISGFIETVAGVAGGAISGAASLASFGISDSLLDVLQGAQIDMPQFWESSSAQLPVASYTMQLRAGGGDFLSQLKGVYIPLFCLLAGSLPQATGEASHVHPFYCQVYDKGRLNKPCAMITNVSISRGVGNLGFDDNWKGLAIDVTFDVTDLTPVMAVPAMPGLLVPGHPMTNYIWALASTELDVYINGLTSMSNSLQRLGRRFNSFFDAANLGNMGAGYIKGSPIRWGVITSYALQAATGEYSDNLDPAR